MGCRIMNIPKRQFALHVKRGLIKPTEWWCDLHQDAMQNVTSEPQRPPSISDKPEVIRDLLKADLLDITYKPSGITNRPDLPYYSLPA